MIFAQMLEIVALSDLASVLCARKFSFAPPRGGVPQITPFSFIIIIIIFKALRLAAVVFMCFFNLAAAERPQHCALVVSWVKMTPMAYMPCKKLWFAQKNWGNIGSARFL